MAVISGNGLKAREVVASSLERITQLPADADTVATRSLMRCKTPKPVRTSRATRP